MFLSALWTLILKALIHCRGSIAEASDVMLHFIQLCLDEEFFFNLGYILNDLKASTFSANLNF